ncbi:unnamed protein product, partial [Polarella glacialis]
VEEQFASLSSSPASAPQGSSGAPASAGTSYAEGSQQGAASAEALREVLRNLRGLAQCVEGLLGAVTVDVLMPVDLAIYGDLAFRVLLHTPTTSRSTVVCVGGRVDRMVRHFAKLHGRQAISGESEGDSSPRRLGRQGHEKPSAVSAELAMDKLADALVQVAQATAAAGGGFFGSRQRGRATSTA